MSAQDTRSRHAVRAMAIEIPIYFSTVPRIHPAARVIVGTLCAAMFGVVVGLSAAHADPVATGETATILAQQSAPKGAGNGPRRPPREAMEVCAQQLSGSACGFSGRDGGQVTGTCRTPASNVPLACVPTDIPHNG